MRLTLHHNYLCMSLNKASLFVKDQLFGEEIKHRTSRQSTFVERIKEKNLYISESEDESSKMKEI